VEIEKLAHNDKYSVLQPSETASSKWIHQATPTSCTETAVQADLEQNNKLKIQQY
jgi:hypothetical protein